VIVLYLLAIIGAALGKASDLCGVEATRRGLGWFDALGVASVLGCYPVWRTMLVRVGPGIVVRPLVAWDVAAQSLTVVIAMFRGEDESPTKRVLFVALVACAVAREIVP
jgi:hypothetical protein